MTRNYRGFQEELNRKIKAVGKADLPLDILCWIVPGGGKSWLPGILCERFPDFKLAWFVPRVTLRLQASSGLLDDFGIRVWESNNTANPSKDTRGFICTHQGLTEDVGLYEAEFRRHKYILVVDENHHAKITRKGESNQLARALDRLAPMCPVIMKMTGTLETNDNTLIWGIKYKSVTNGQEADPENSAKIYVRYSRKDALSDGNLVPMHFDYHDGPVTYDQLKGGKTTHKLSKAKDDQIRKGIFTALSTEIATQLLDRCLDDFRKRGRKLIVVCNSQGKARKYAELLMGCGLGEIALAITEEGPEALAAIKRFKKHCNVLVTCAMAYEGLDVKAVTHICCLTHIRSTPWIEQMLARAWRVFEGKGMCWAFVPDDPYMIDIVNVIRAEEISVIPPEGPPPPPSEKVNNYVPLSSAVESIRQEMLDMEKMRGQIIDLLGSVGIDPDDPVIEQAVAASMQRRELLDSDPETLTPTEEATRYRLAITDMCREADSRMPRDESGKLPFGHHQKLLYQHIRVRFEEATLEELKHAAKIAEQICTPR